MLIKISSSSLPWRKSHSRFRPEPHKLLFNSVACNTNSQTCIGSQFYFVHLPSILPSRSNRIIDAEALSSFDHTFLYATNIGTSQASSPAKRSTGLDYRKYASGLEARAVRWHRSRMTVFSREIRSATVILRQTAFGAFSAAYNGLEPHRSLSALQNLAQRCISEAGASCSAPKLRAASISFYEYLGSSSSMALDSNSLPVHSSHVVRHWKHLSLHVRSE